MAAKIDFEWRGVFTALVTPFDSGGAVDTAALRSIVEHQIASGVSGLAPCGTTGEGATLTDEERNQVIATVVEESKGKVPVIAGCGSNDTRKTVAAAKQAAAAGADGLLVVSPYYNKPNRSGMKAHYRAVAEATDLPVVVYNVPGRTGQNLGAPLLIELAAIPGVKAIKEAAADLEQLNDLLAGRPDGLAVLSGDDPLTLAAVATGADGVISVVSNEAPAEMSAMVRAVLDSDLARARELHFRLLPLIQANFAESNPVPVKTAMSLLGRCLPDVRAPLGRPSAQTVETVRAALLKAGLAPVESAEVR